MNRKIKRRVEKNMGITKFRKQETKKQKFNRYFESSIEANKKEDEMKEIRRLQENRTDEQKQSTDIALKATEIMVQEGLSYIDALEKAKQLIEVKLEEK